MPHSTCDDVRSALSARLDGEEPLLPERTVDRHLDRCPTCQAWQAGAERVTRAVRLQAVRVPDLTARILAAAHAEGALPGARRSGRLWEGPIRWALGLFAVTQIMIAVPQLLGAAGHDAHAGREVAALDIAISVGLLVAACYPEYARVFVPVAIALVFCFGAISALDMIEGAVTPTRIAIHILTVAQASLVWLLARRTHPASQLA
jgi:predicted anti-sigma-YlaC factor YlaD